MMSAADESSCESSTRLHSVGTKHTMEQHNDKDPEFRLYYINQEEERTGSPRDITAVSFINQSGSLVLQLCEFGSFIFVQAFHSVCCGSTEQKYII